MHWLVVAMALGASPSETLDLSSLQDTASLSPTVWHFVPELQLARARVAQAQADAQKTRLLPNPAADVAVGTIPVGPLNPVGLSDPYLNVPNLQVGLSVLLEIAKRGPRQTAAQENARAVALDALDQLRNRVSSLEDAIGEVAAAQVRVATVTALVADAQKLAGLQRARSDKGDTSSLDADRAQLEQQATQATLGEAIESVQAALRSCGTQAGVPCLPFRDEAQAAEWLARAVPFATDLTARPDLRALEAATRSAEASRTLAQNRPLPDPTLRVGYVHDRFVVSGNQQNSLFVGVSVPLNLFDRGQTDALAAESSARATTTARERLLAGLPKLVERLTLEFDSVEARQRKLRDESLPLAASIVDRLGAAVTRGAAPLQELLLARRAYAELRLLDNELELTSYRLRVERARLLGASLNLPEELSDAAN